ncbi:ABC transporter substrate-binding protein [Pseudomonas sp. R2.Fl]|nr:ABC transporter substrate-binding protein [Pseudomonas sp. R2.Fl]
MLKLPAEPIFSHSTGHIALTRRHALGLMLGAGLASAFANNPAFAQDAAVSGGILKVSASNNPSSLDPITGRSGYDHAMLYPIFDTLFEFDFQTLQPKPGLAKAWNYTDPKTLVIDLNENVVFHDGTPFDAEAVKFNLERALTLENSAVKTDLASIESVEVASPTQVVLHLKNPDSSLILVLADRSGMMVSPTAARAQGEAFARNPVGAGRWAFVSWTDNAKVVVKRNEKYWRDGQPYLDGIEFTIIPELNTGLRSVIAGENDLVYQISLQQEPIIKSNSDISATILPSLNIHMLYLNMSRPPFNDKRVRQALNFAIDRQAFNQITRDGEPTWTLLPKEHWACDPGLANAYPYDPEKAKALLAEAGLSGGLDLFCMGWNDQKAVQRQEILIEQFRQVGIRARFETASVADSTQLFMSEKRGDAYLGAFTGRPDPSQVFQRLFDPNSVVNAGRVDPVPERAAAQLATQTAQTLVDRQKAFFALQKLVSENALCVPITVQHDVTVFTNKVVGFRPNLTGKPKFEDVSLKA